MIHASAHHECRIETGLTQHGSYHGGSRRLSVRAGHCDSIFQAHQLGQHLGTRDDGDFQLMSLHHFHVVRVNCGRNHDYMRAANVFRQMAFKNGSS